MDIYGKTRSFVGESSFIPFTYQGQYYDVEIELAYNRFRWYDFNSGIYISQDPIGLLSGQPNLYAYVYDSNTWIDPLGLIAELYQLVAERDGMYDLKEWGKPTKKNVVFLKEGEVWKFGETIQFNKNGIQKRYSQSWLRRNGLKYESIKTLPNKSDKKIVQGIETLTIGDYVEKNGHLPAGNACRH